MNHGVDETAAIIGAVVERCALDDIPLSGIYIDPELGGELGLMEGKAPDHGSKPTIYLEAGLGRRLRFERG
jgi:hypothetical protein